MASRRREAAQAFSKETRRGGEMRSSSPPAKKARTTTEDQSRSLSSGRRPSSKKARSPSPELRPSKKPRKVDAEPQHSAPPQRLELTFDNIISASGPCAAGLRNLLKTSPLSELAFLSSAITSLGCTAVATALEESGPRTLDIIGDIGDIVKLHANSPLDGRPINEEEWEMAVQLVAAIDPTRQPMMPTAVLSKRFCTLVDCKIKPFAAARENEDARALRTIMCDIATLMPEIVDAELINQFKALLSKFDEPADSIAATQPTAEEEEDDDGLPPLPKTEISTATIASLLEMIPRTTDNSTAQPTLEEQPSDAPVSSAEEPRDEASADAPVSPAEEPRDEAPTDAPLSSADAPVSSAEEPRDHVDKTPADAPVSSAEEPHDEAPTDAPVSPSVTDVVPSEPAVSRPAVGKEPRGVPAVLCDFVNSTGQTISFGEHVITGFAGTDVLFSIGREAAANILHKIAAVELPEKSNNSHVEKIVMLMNSNPATAGGLIAIFAQLAQMATRGLHPKWFQQRDDEPPEISGDTSIEILFNALTHAFGISLHTVQRFSANLQFAASAIHPTKGIFDRKRLLTPSDDPRDTAGLVISFCTMATMAWVLMTATMVDICNGSTPCSNAMQFVGLLAPLTLDCTVFRLTVRDPLTGTEKDTQPSVPILFPVIATFLKLGLPVKLGAWMMRLLPTNVIEQLVPKTCKIELLMDDGVDPAQWSTSYASIVRVCAVFLLLASGSRGRQRPDEWIVDCFQQYGPGNTSIFGSESWIVEALSSNELPRAQWMIDIANHPEVSETDDVMTIFAPFLSTTDKGATFFLRPMPVLWTNAKNDDAVSRRSRTSRARRSGAKSVPSKDTQSVAGKAKPSSKSRSKKSQPSAQSPPAASTSKAAQSPPKSRGKMPQLSPQRYCEPSSDENDDDDDETYHPSKEEPDAVTLARRRTAGNKKSRIAQWANDVTEETRATAADDPTSPFAAIIAQMTADAERREQEAQRRTQAMFQQMMEEVNARLNNKKN